MIRGIKVEVRQNFEGNFYYQLLSDTVGVFSTFEDAEREGNSALSTVVEKFTSHNKPNTPFIACQGGCGHESVIHLCQLCHDTDQY